MSFFKKIFDSKPEEQPQKPSKVKEVKQNPEDVIIAKLKKSNRQALSMPEDELREWATSLCVAKELKEWYLNPDFAATTQTFNKLEQVNAKIVNNQKKEGNIFQSALESQPVPDEGDEDFKVDDIDFGLDDIEKENKLPNMKIGQKVKVKLVIAEICKSDAQKAIRKLLSPVLTKIDHQQQFGMFHSALVVGPWYLEWNNSSLCIPRKCYSSAAMLAADLDLGLSFELNETIEKISKVIIDWNVNKVYNQRNANCQQFIDDLCNELGIDLNKFEGPLGEYMKNLREKGECSLIFPISPDMRENLKIREKSMKFETHEEIDKFARELQEKVPTFEEEYQEHWLLLKSFDRAFWLRHFKHQDDPKYSPCSNGCPFKDPTHTTSFKREWF